MGRLYVILLSNNYHRMKFELNLEKPEPNRSWISALTIGFSYFGGGLVPLMPYAIISKASVALIVSAIVTIIALFIFGYVKSILLGKCILFYLVILGNSKPIVGALQMTFVGAIAAGAAFGIAKTIPQVNNSI